MKKTVYVSPEILNGKSLVGTVSRAAFKGGVKCNIVPVQFKPAERDYTSRLRFRSVGETMAEGDEFLYMKEWKPVPAAFVGRQVLMKKYIRTRRPQVLTKKKV